MCIVKRSGAGPGKNRGADSLLNAHELLLHPWRALGGIFLVCGDVLVWALRAPPTRPVSFPLSWQTSPFFFFQGTQLALFSLIKCCESPAPVYLPRCRRPQKSLLLSLHRCLCRSKPAIQAQLSTSPANSASLLSSYLSSALSLALLAKVGHLVQVYWRKREMPLVSTLYDGTLPKDKSYTRLNNFDINMRNTTSHEWTMTSTDRTQFPSTFIHKVFSKNMSNRFYSNKYTFLLYLIFRGEYSSNGRAIICYRQVVT